MAQSSNKIQIPKKTKIAIKIMTIYSLLALILVLAISTVIAVATAGDISILTKPEWIFSCFMLVLCFVSARLLARGVYLSWNLSFIVIFLAAAGSLQNFAFRHNAISFAISLVFIAILFLLISDRKKYFAAVEAAKDKIN